MKKTFWFITLAWLSFFLLVALFMWSYTSPSAYWQNFALNLLTDLIGALVVAFLLEKLLRQAYIEYREEQVDIASKMFQEYIARTMYWLLFETSGLEVILQRTNLNDKDTDKLVKEIIRVIPKIISESTATVIFHRKDDRVKNILLNVLRSSLREPLTDMSVPPAFSIFSSKGRNTLELRATDALEVLEKALPKMLESKEIQLLANPLLIEAMRKFPENSELFRRGFM